MSKRVVISLAMVPLAVVCGLILKELPEWLSTSILTGGAFSVWMWFAPWWGWKK
jgi:hypothetical protein